MSNASPFGAFVPGFDFLQGLVKNAGQALPSVGQWVAPTLDPAELEKRINELKTVQFWLEQNARMIATTIQALEVQRMTLSTLKTMNVSMTDLRDAMTLKPAASAPSPAPAPAPEPPKARAAEPPAEPEAAAPAPAMPGVVDPMAWWGALTQQFTEIATHAMSDSRTEAAREAMGAMMKQAVAMPAAVAQQAAEVAQQATEAVQAVAKAPRRRAAAAAQDSAAEGGPAPATDEPAATKPRRAASRKTSG